MRSGPPACYEPTRPGEGRSINYQGRSGIRKVGKRSTGRAITFGKPNLRLGRWTQTELCFASARSRVAAVAPQHRRGVTRDLCSAVLAVANMPISRGKIPRINYSKAHQIQLSDQDWTGIEDAYGCSISQKVRELIVAATNEFLRLATAESTGLMQDALTRANRLRERTQALITAIDERPLGDVTREYVDDEIALSNARQNASKFRKLLGLRIAPLAERKYVIEFFHDLNRFASACELTLQELDHASQHNYWLDGAAWEIWIRSLTRLLEASKLPTIP